MQFGPFSRSLMTVKEYREALERVHERIHQVFPKAKTIFVLTTPLCAGGLMAYPRTLEDVMYCNVAALEIMAELNVLIVNLFEVAQEIPDELCVDAVYYKDEGY